MTGALRRMARRLLGVQRSSTYYLPWLTRPGLDCALLLSDVEARFNPAHKEGPFPLRVEQYGADGALARVHDVSLRDAVDARELHLEPATGGCGFAIVRSERVNADLYVTLSDGEAYTATHGRGEFVERYPLRARALITLLGGALALLGRTIPAFARDQYGYVGPDSRSHLLLMNLSNVTNRIRVAASVDGRPLGARLVTLPPMGSSLLDVSSLSPGTSLKTGVWRLRLEGNAWFNFYVVGAGTRDLAGPLSLMHVK
jgi:hypothetical protein